MLIKAGVDAKHRSKDDVDVLYYAAQYTNDINIFKTLFNAGASVEYQPNGDVNEFLTNYVQSCNDEVHKREVNSDVIKLFVFRGLNVETIEEDEVMDLAMPFILEKSEMKPEDLKNLENEDKK